MKEHTDGKEEAEEEVTNELTRYSWEVKVTVIVVCVLERLCGLDEDTFGRDD